MVQQDTSGKGAVFCFWNLYVTTEAAAHYCGLPADVANDTAISRIDKFIVANAKSPTYTQQQLDAMQKNYLTLTTSAASRLGGKIKFCQNPDLQAFRKATPEQTEKFVDNLLSIPREPLMNPCL